MRALNHQPQYFPFVAERPLQQRDALHLDLNQVGQAGYVWTHATADGPDYVWVCPLHQWASVPVVTRADLSGCPECDASAGSEPGRRRYRDLVGLFDRG